MRAVLSLCFLVAVAHACPTPPCGCDSSPPPCDDQPWAVPPYIPSDWTVKSLDNAYASECLHGKWYLQWSSSIYVHDQKPMQTGMFYTGWPGCSNQLYFQDSTPGEFDLNLDITLTDCAYNRLTGKVDVTQAKLKPAYGDKTNICLFTIATPMYYNIPLVGKEIIDDKHLLRHDLSGRYKREYVVAFIDSDTTGSYIIMVVLDRYEYLFSRVNDGYMVFVFTRDQIPQPCIYQNVVKDLTNCNLKSNYLMNIDQSYTISSQPNYNDYCSDDDSSDMVLSTSTTTSKSTSSTTSVTDECGTTMSSSSTTQETTTVSTVVVDIDDSYKSPYEFFPYPVSCDCEPFKIFKDVPLDVIGNILTGTYCVNSATLFTYTEMTDNTRVGLLNNVSPCSSLQVCFYRPNSDNPFDVNTPILVLDRGFNMITNEVQQTRSVLAVAQNDGYVTIKVYTEGYYPTQFKPINHITVDGITIQNPSPDIYTNEYTLIIVGFEVDSFVILYVVDQFPNMLCPDMPTNQIIVLTRDQEIDTDTMININQQILYAGLNPATMVFIDWSYPYTDEFSFDDLSYFQMETYYSSSGIVTSSTSSTRSTSSTSSTSRSIICNDKPLSDDQCPSACTIPPYIPSTWTVKSLDNAYASECLHGTWYLQWSSLVNVPGNKPMHTGMFYTGWPGCSNQIDFQDSTPGEYDLNLDILLTDYAYNRLNGNLDITHAKLKPAYGANTNICLFTIATPKYYDAPLVVKQPIDDSLLIRHDLTGPYEREYIAAFIDTCTNGDYIIMVIVDQYDFMFSGVNDGHMVFVFTRDQVAKPDIYQNVINDLNNSNIKPYYLMNIDQSYTISSQPNCNDYCSDDDSSDMVLSTSTTTSKSSSSTRSVTDECGTTMSSSSSTQETTTVSTVVVDIDDSYKSPYEFFPYPVSCDCEPFKIFKDVPLDVIGNILTGTYCVNSATLFTYAEMTDDTRVGLLNNVSPCSSLQVCFYRPNSDNPFDVNTPILVLDRGFNMITNEVQQTRSVLAVAQNDGYVTIKVYTEGYYPTQFKPINQITVDGITIQNPSPDIYTNEYTLIIVGFEVDSFVILYVVDQFPNMLCPDMPTNQIIVLTRDQEIDTDTMININQQILYAGLNPATMVFIDWSYPYTDEFSFDDLSYFQMESYYSSSVSTCSSSSTVEESKIVAKSSSSITSSSSSSSLSTLEGNVDMC